jgi:hypothetical protein
MIEWDMYDFTKVAGDNISCGLRGDEKQILQPCMRPNSRDIDTSRIGMWI